MAGLLIALVVMGGVFVIQTRPAAAVDKSVYIPAGWKQTGEVPWSQDRTQESANFILLWGEKSGTSPASAPAPYTFDPNSVLTQLDNLYSFSVNDMKFTPGLAMFNRIWNEARNTEHPLETYRRITGITQPELNRRMGEYATRTMTYDFGNKATLTPFIKDVYGAGFLNSAYNGGNVEAVSQSVGHYRINSRVAPADYGLNKIKLVPATDGAKVSLRLKGHAETGATGWAFGLVAVKNGTLRYSPLTTGSDGRIDFQLEAGESEVWLVTTATPTAVPRYAFLDGYTKAGRYPYEFRVSGATPSGFEAGCSKPAATNGGRWHTNGGGWVSNRANVAASAYVGPKAAVVAGTVSGNARIEGLGGVNGGTVSGNAVVKDNALIQAGANLSGSVVVGGDAEFAIACSSGTYLAFNPDRKCDGGAGESDINPAFTAFSSAELAL